MPTFVHILPLNDKIVSGKPTNTALQIDTKCRTNSMTPANANSAIAGTKNDIVIIDSEVGFNTADIQDDAAFGNGVSCISLRLKNGSKVRCCIFVSETNHSGSINTLKNISKGLV